MHGSEGMAEGAAKRYVFTGNGGMVADEEEDKSESNLRKGRMHDLAKATT